MKLHLPVLLRAALLSAFVVSSQGFAGDYQNGSLVKENQTGTIYNDYSGSFALNSYEALTFRNNVSVIYGQEACRCSVTAMFCSRGIKASGMVPPSVPGRECI